MKTPKQFYLEYKNADIAHKRKVKAFITMFFSLLTAIFKFVFGIIIKSLVWAYSSVYALGASIEKLLFFKSTHDKYNERNKINFCITISVILILSGVIFDMCTMIKQFDDEKVTEYPLFIIIIASIYFFVSYIFTIIGLIRNRKNKDLGVFSYKIIGVSGALMNMVLLQRMIISALNLPLALFKQINSTFGYLIGATLVLTAILLLIKCLVRRKNYPKQLNEEIEQ